MSKNDKKPTDCGDNKQLNHKNEIAALQRAGMVILFRSFGGMAEWPNAPVLKTGNGLSRSRVRIPIPPPHSTKKPAIYSGLFCWAELLDERVGSEPWVPFC
jgi:hypothetical protein